MKNILRIDSSPKLHSSYTREIADYFQTKWLQLNSTDTFTKRDLARETIPHLSENAIIAFNTHSEFHNKSMKENILLSDILIDELMSCDILLISTPMHNFGIPSSMKAYIDHIIRVGRTIALTRDNESQGLVRDKPTFIVTACGLHATRKTREIHQYFYKYLKNILNYIGIYSVNFISIEGTKTSPATAAKMTRDAKRLVDTYINEYHEGYPTDRKVV